jgi:sugar-specific transcriptional regulator TrmB
MKYTSELKQLGLTANESSVYIASLRVGNARVSRIASEANLPKSTTNDTLETLLSKGLVSRYQHKNRFYFTAADPGVLNSWFERKQSLLTNLLPKLYATQRTAAQQPSIRTYFDKDGFYTVEREILAEAKEILIISPAKDLDELLPDHFSKFMVRRLKRRIPARILIEDSPIAEYVQALDKTAIHQTRVLRPPVPFESLMLIWNNKVATVSLDTQVTIVIQENKNVTQMITSLFELLWNSSTE